jgi:hypothetical protein
MNAYSRTVLDAEGDIITTPRTAGRNICTALCRDAYWVIGPDPFDEESINHHCTKIHKGWHRRGIVDEALKIYIICRDPYTRLVGLFLHYEWAQDKGLAEKYICWEEFVYNKDKLNWMFNKTIAEFIKASGLEDYKIIRYENLEENLSKILGYEVSLPSKYHELINFKEWYHDPKLLKYVNDNWAKEDCELFGYPMR